MNNIKKTLLYMFIILFIISLYKDLTVGTPLNSTNNQYENEYNSEEANDLTVMRVKVQQGETVLSIVEQINQQKINTMDIKQIIADFEALNPTVNDPEKLKTNTFYYFPVYEKEADI
ncbi:hypothetical protein [Virgibacillus doumboii]|uniref:hypothetical protein n=1 Tax=Virgibacillus doumboii TaxID=2697503 RepID=UPI0013DE9A1B|nr:hypothetical protein [Virgibacillus doumboii]